MTTPALPTSGSTSWYSWAAAVDNSALRGGLPTRAGGTTAAAAALPFVNVKDFGADSTGGTDSTTAFSAAAAAHPHVWVPKGDYLVSNLTLPSRTKLVGSGPEKTRLIQNQSSGVMITATGTYAGKASPTATLTADATPNSYALMVGSTTGFVAGDMLLLGSSAQIVGASTTQYIGELLVVDSVGSSTVLNVQGAVRDTYRVSDSAAAYKITPVQNVELADLSLVNLSPGTTTTQMTLFAHGRDVRVSNVSVLGADGPGIAFRNIMGFTASDVHIRNFSDSDAASQFGYGVLVQGACEQGVVSVGTFHKVRHAVTTDGMQVECGQPRNITFSNLVGTGTTHPTFDSHAAGRDITYVACSAVGSRSDGFQIRSLDTTLSACRASYSLGKGLHVVGTSGRLLTGARINGFTTRHNANHDVLFEYVDDVTLASFDLEGARFNGIDCLNTVNRLHILNGRIANCGFGGSGQGIQFENTCTGTGNIVSDTWFVNQATGDSTTTPGQMRYGVWIGTGMSGTVVADNKGLGLITGFVNDGGTGTIQSSNRRVDVTEAAAFANGITTKVKAGTPSDADFVTAPADGAIVGDSTTAKFWMRQGGAWVATPSVNETLAPNLIKTGQETIPRDGIIQTNMSLTSGTVEFTYFTARKTETSTQVAVYIGGNAAGATPTLCRVGLYTVDGSNNLTLVASTPNDTAGMASANSFYTKSWSVSVGMVAGQRYALGVLVVSAAAMPQMAGNGNMPNVPGLFRSPPLASKLAAQTDLPATVTSGSLAGSGHRNYAEILP